MITLQVCGLVYVVFTLCFMAWLADIGGFADREYRLAFFLASLVALPCLILFGVLFVGVVFFVLLPYKVWETWDDR